MTKNYNVLNKGDINMISKINYIKRGTKYIVGAGAMIVGLSSAAFGIDENGGYYAINNAEDLIEFAKKVNEGNVSAKGKLMDNIAFSGQEWTAIGTEKNPFEGELISNGDKKTITGLYIDKKAEDNQGLFGYVGREGKVSNINVNNLYINGKNCVGVIAGCNEGEITNCVTSGIILGQNDVGGIVGDNKGVIKNVESKGQATGQDNVGGIVGCNSQRGRIEGNCKCSAVDLDVTISGNNYIGGIVGCNEGIIKGDFENERQIDGKHYVGGIVGYNNEGTIEDGKYVNDAAIVGKENVGGNIGCNQGKQGEKDMTEIEGVYFNKGVIKGNQHVGGNIGRNIAVNIKGEMVNDGVVEGEEDIIGGNVGYNQGVIISRCVNSAAIGGKNKVGGNVGFNQGTIEITTKFFNLEKVKGDSSIGGNVGHNGGTITMIRDTENTGKLVQNTGCIEGNGDDIGGNIGYNGGPIDVDCNNESGVQGKNNVGGNIGYNFKEEVKGNYYNESDVQGVGSVGGNVGLNEGKILGTYGNKGNVKGENKVGGFIGWNKGEYAVSENDVKNSGKINGKDNVNDLIGLDE